VNGPKAWWGKDDVRGFKNQRQVYDSLKQVMLHEAGATQLTFSKS